MTWILSQDYRDGVFTDAIADDVRRLIGVRLRSGLELGQRFPAGLGVIVRPPPPPSDFFTAGPLVVVSSGMKAVLDVWAARVEWFRLSVRSADADVPSTDAFWCPNVLATVDRLDRARSEFTPRADFAADVQRIALAPVADEPPLYLLARVTPSTYCVRDDLADALIRARLTGFVLSRDADWRP